MTDKTQRFNDKSPKEIPIKPFIDPDLKPGKSNPINPKTDEPSGPSKNRKEEDSSKIKNPVQEDPGSQNTG